MKKLAGIVVILLILGGGYWFLKKKPAAVPQKEQVKQEQTQVPAQRQPSQQPPAETPQNTTPTQLIVQKISMTSGMFFFNPKEITLKKGRPVEISIQNSGHHTFTIDELGVNQSLGDGTTVVKFTPDTAGVFIYYCAVPGHRQAGQWGTATVEE